LGSDFLLPPWGTAIAKPTTPTQATTSSQQDSLFPEVGSSRYDVKHYAISLSYQSSGDIKAKTTLTAKARKSLTSFSLDLEGLTVDKVRVNGHKADFSRRDNKLIIKPSEVLVGRFSATIWYHGSRSLTSIRTAPRTAGFPPSDGATVLSEPVGAMTWFPQQQHTARQGDLRHEDHRPVKPRGGWQRRSPERPEA
jgi:aminopeptidase N